MAFEGGGFKAHSAHTGVISALLSAQASAANGGLKQLLGEIKVISSNSGGSWFMSQLAYSPSFLSLVETVAAAPANAHQLYLDGWVIPFIQGLSPFQGDLAPASTRLQSKPLTAHNWTKTGPVRQTNNNRIGDARNARVTEVLFNILEVLYEVYFLSKMQSSWQDFVTELLQSTSGDMPDTETLGSKVNSWAEEKWWLLGTSIATPGGTGPATCSGWIYNWQVCGSALIGEQPHALIFGNSTGNTWTYSVNKAVKTPVASWTPARFSTVMGAGNSAKAPMKFCEVCEDARFDYQAKGSAATSPQQRNFPAFDSSDTSLFAAVSASSAFLGEFVSVDWWNTYFQDLLAQSIAEFIQLPGLNPEFVQWLENGLLNLLHAQLPVWAASASNGVESFTKATGLLKLLQKSNGQPANLSLPELAKDGLFGLVDGALTDNTAIGHALAAGLDEVICIMDGIDDLWDLMGGVPSHMDILQVPILGSLINTCPFCYANFQLFAESSEDGQEQWHTNSQQLMMHKVDTLNSLAVGTLELTTVKNAYFGVSGGRSIKLHVVNVESGLFIGGFAYQDYATLVQDVVSVFLSPDNENSTRMVLEWFTA